MVWLAPLATSYNVKRSTTYGGSYTLIATNITTLNYTDTGLTSGTTYYYVVSASNSYGDSPDSSQAVQGLTAIIPILNTNEIVVAMTTPQQYGAKGDGITDDSAAFQNAMNAVYRSGGNGGGVIYVPPANYAFANPISIPTGVTLHGDWQDWTKGSGGCVGTTFKVYCGAGSTNNPPFITMGQSAALKGINLWYPNQNPNSITPYPYTIALNGNCVVQNVVLVNPYLGIQANGATEWILSTVIGSPLYLGLWADAIADICQTEDVRFSPAVWASSGLTNAPSVGGAYATWMMANGTGMQIYRADGIISQNTTISGYNHGLDFEQDANGNAGCAFYNGYVTNCNIAVQATSEQSASGLEFSDCTLVGSGHQCQQQRVRRHGSLQPLYHYWHQRHGRLWQWNRLEIRDGLSSLHHFQCAATGRAGSFQLGGLQLARQHAMCVERQCDPGGLYRLHLQSKSENREQRQCGQSDY